MIHRCPQIFDLLGGVLELYEDGVLYDCIGNIWNVLYNGHDPFDSKNTYDGGGDDQAAGFADG